MRTFRSIWLGFVIAAALPAQQPGPIEPPLIGGAELYKAYCASCHGVSGKGDGPAAQELKASTPDLTGLSERSGGKFPRAKVEAMIRNESGPRSHGTAEMPIWGPAFTRATPLDTESRDKLRVLAGSEATSAELSRMRIENLLDFIAEIQSGATRRPSTN